MRRIKARSASDGVLRVRDGVLSGSGRASCPSRGGGFQPPGDDAGCRGHGFAWPRSAECDRITPPHGGWKPPPPVCVERKPPPPVCGEWKPPPRVPGRTHWKIPRSRGGLGSEYPMPNAQCPVPNAQCPMPNAQCPMPNAQCPMPSAQCPVPSAQCPMPNPPRRSRSGLWGIPHRLRSGL